MTTLHFGFCWQWSRAAVSTEDFRRVRRVFAGERAICSFLGSVSLVREWTSPEATPTPPPSAPARACSSVRAHTAAPKDETVDLSVRESVFVGTKTLFCSNKTPFRTDVFVTTDEMSARLFMSVQLSLSGCCLTGHRARTFGDVASLFLFRSRFRILP